MEKFFQIVAVPKETLRVNPEEGSRRAGGGGGLKMLPCDFADRVGLWAKDSGWVLDAKRDMASGAHGREQLCWHFGFSRVKSILDLGFPEAQYKKDMLWELLSLY